MSNVYFNGIEKYISDENKTLLKDKNIVQAEGQEGKFYIFDTEENRHGEINVIDDSGVVDLIWYEDVRDSLDPFGSYGRCPIKNTDDTWNYSANRYSACDNINYAGFTLAEISGEYFSYYSSIVQELMTHAPEEINNKSIRKYKFRFMPVHTNKGYRLIQVVDYNITKVIGYLAFSERKDGWSEIKVELVRNIAEFRDLVDICKEYTAKFNEKVKKKGE